MNECEHITFLYYSTSSEPSIELNSVGLKHILILEGGWMFRVCKINYIKSLVVLCQNCQHSFAVVHIRAQEIVSSQIL